MSPRQKFLRHLSAVELTTDRASLSTNKEPFLARNLRYFVVREHYIIVNITKIRGEMRVNGNSMRSGIYDRALRFEDRGEEAEDP